MTTAVNKATVSINDVSTYAEAIAAFGDEILYVDTPEVVEKETLIDVPFFVMSWRHNTDKATGRPFVSVEAVTVENRKVVINDGSTGIMAQLCAIEERAGRAGGVMVPRGLRVSVYGVDGQGRPIAAGSDEKPVSVAKTFYLQ